MLIGVMSMILTKSAFAARRGVSASAVSAWIKRGHLEGAALTVDGRINLVEAERQLADRLDLSRSLGKTATVANVPPSPPLTPASAPASSLAAIKLEQAQIQLRRDREEDHARRGRYTLTIESDRAHASALVQFLATVEQRGAELIALLEVPDQKKGVLIFRRWWRGLRQSETDTAQQRAATLPEFVTDAAE
jgi:hypothetical protein